MPNKRSLKTPKRKIKPKYVLASEISQNQTTYKGPTPEERIIVVDSLYQQVQKGCRYNVRVESHQFIRRSPIFFRAYRGRLFLVGDEFSLDLERHPNLELKLNNEALEASQMDTNNSRPSARTYLFTLINQAGEFIKQRVSKNIFGEITRTDSWNFKPLTFEVNGISKTLKVVKWAGNDGKESSSVTFDLLNDELDEPTLAYFSLKGYDILKDYQMTGVTTIRPKKADKPQF